jgi:hypothetical protein
MPRPLQCVPDGSLPRLNLRKKNARRPPRCAGDGPHALSVSTSRVRLGQDRLRSVHGGGATGQS